MVVTKILVRRTIFSWKIDPSDQNSMENWSMLGPVMPRIDSIINQLYYNYIIYICSIFTEIFA